MRGEGVFVVVLISYNYLMYASYRFEERYELRLLAQHLTARSNNKNGQRADLNDNVSLCWYTTFPQPWLRNECN